MKNKYLNFIPPSFRYPPVVEDKNGAYVELDSKQYMLIRDFISPAASKKLTPTRYLMYYLVSRFWGSIDKAGMLKMMGYTPKNADDRFKTVKNLAYSVGNRLTDVCIASQQYLATWNLEPTREKTKAAHEELLHMLPGAYQVAALFLANSDFTQEKDFKEFIATVITLSNIAEKIHKDQHKRIHIKERKVWLSEFYVQAYRLRKACAGLVGVGSTTTLVLK